MREITGGLVAARAWIRLGAVWVNMNSRAFDTSQQCFSLLAVPQGIAAF